MQLKLIVSVIFVLVSAGVAFADSVSSPAPPSPTDAQQKADEDAEALNRLSEQTRDIRHPEKEPEKTR